MIIVGIDPGLAFCGLSAIELGPKTERLIEAKVLTTEKGKGMLRGTLSEDNLRRAMRLSIGIWHFLHRHRPFAIAAEAQSWVRDAGSSAKVGMAWGVLASVAMEYGTPVFQVSPQAIRKHLLPEKPPQKRKVDRKRETIEAVERKFGPLGENIPRSIADHAADSIGAVLATLRCPEIAMARKATHATPVRKP